DTPAVETGVERAARDRVLALVEAAPELLVAVVELRQRLVAEPRLVAALVVEEVEAALLAAGARRGEPLVLVARVVEREVADHAQAALVRRADERLQRLVAAEQRVDPTEAGRVVAMRRARREDRRQVDDVGAEALDVIQSLLDPVQLAAVQLERRVAAAAGRQVVPVAPHRPGRGVAAVAV